MKRRRQERGVGGRERENDDQQNLKKLSDGEFASAK